MILEEKKSKITIGITVYNAADTLETAIRSAMAQTWRPIEILIVDDCSTDKSNKILENLKSQHDEIHVFKNDRNMGVAFSRNRILDEARGEFVVFFDDDESLPERIENQYQRILEYERDYANGAPVVCHSARRLIYPDGNEHIAFTMGENESEIAPNGISVAERILLGTPLKNAYGACPTCSQMARLTTYHLLKGFDSDFRRSEDTDFNIRLAKVGGHFVGVEQPLVLQYMTKTSEKNLDEEHRYTRMLLDKHRDIPDRYGLYAFCNRWIDAKQAWLERKIPSFIFTMSSLFISHPLLSFSRLYSSIPNIELNRNFSLFHSRLDN